MQMPARLLVDLVQHDREQPLKILDIAAGHGIFGITLAEQFPHAHVTALDWPNVLHVAQDNAEQAGVSDRYSLLPGSAFEIDWAGPYDLVLLTNILHHFDLELCLQLAKKSHACLTDTGRAITLEFIPDEDRITPASTAGFALTMLTTTASGDAYTFAEYDQILQQAGFFHNEFHPLPPTTQQAIVSHKSLAQK
jgi:ubiquinone/menaquinone biosynthesis C-methylase UbiE